MKTKKIILTIFKLLSFISGLASLVSIIVEIGFYISESDIQMLRKVVFASIYIIVTYQIFRFIFSENKKVYFLNRKFELIFALAAFLEILSNIFYKSLLSFFFDAIKIKNFAYIYVLIAQTFIVLELFLSFLRYNKKLLSSKINPSRLFIGSFLIMILIGSFALSLPKATINGIRYIDALFISASSVCVTGLTTINVAENFTYLGQFIIMLLIQIGGLGLITFTTFFAIFLAGGLGIKERMQLKDIFEEDNLNALTKIIIFIIAATLLIETIGAIFLFYCSGNCEFKNLNEKIFFSVFHSISAFCNAGFSLYKDGLYDPSIRNNLPYLLYISILIILGGIGFPTILDILKRYNIFSIFKKTQNRLSLQTKIVLISIIVLLITGSLGFYFLEKNNSLKEFNTIESKLIHSFFQSASYRTAGFNAVNYTLTSKPTNIFGMFLMFIGAAPGGTAGGIKVTTFFILLVFVYSYIRNKYACSIYNRSISISLALRALVKFFVSISILSIAIFILSIFENASLLEISFECASAFGTVGLSLGITPYLTDIGKITIILLMFIGRVTPLAILYSIIKEAPKENIQYPNENISII